MRCGRRASPRRAPGPAGHFGLAVARLEGVETVSFPGRPGRQSAAGLAGSATREPACTSRRAKPTPSRHAKNRHRAGRAPASAGRMSRHDDPEGPSSLSSLAIPTLTNPEYEITLARWAPCDQAIHLHEKPFKASAWRRRATMRRSQSAPADPSSRESADRSPFFGRLLGVVVARLCRRGVGRRAAGTAIVGAGGRCGRRRIGVMVEAGRTRRRCSRGVRWRRGRVSAGGPVVVSAAARSWCPLAVQWSWCPSADGRVGRVRRGAVLV